MKLNIKFEESASSFPVTLINNEEDLEVNFMALQILDGDTTPYYDGTYIVIPKFSTQNLNTATKRMRNNVMVRPIPILSISNPQGGMTVTIGSI